MDTIIIDIFLYKGGTYKNILIFFYSYITVAQNVLALLFQLEILCKTIKLAMLLINIFKHKKKYSFDFKTM